MDDLTMPAAADFVLPPPPPGFDRWVLSPGGSEWSAAFHAGTPTAYVEYCTGDDGPYVTYHFVAKKDS